MSIYVLFFSVWAVFSPNKPQKTRPSVTDDMPMCSTVPQVGNYWGTTLAVDFPSVKATPSVLGFDTSKSYTMPLLALTQTGDVLLSWTEKDGSLVAVFSNRSDAPTPTTQEGRGRGRSLDIVYCTSKDGGATWTTPQSVDTDPTKGIVRGFFDAVVLPNDEIAVAYLKDVKGSTKHEERDLRLVLTKNSVF